jgi:membrane protein implicated in regulation of membrane protease activity
MGWPDIYLLCFAVGSLWSITSLLLGGLHLGHSGSAHGVHGHLGHTHASHGHLVHGHVTHPHAGDHGQAARPLANDVSWIGSLINPSCSAVFLAWFGGIGYLLTRHSGLGFWIDLGIAVAVGLMGAWFLAAFLHFLQAREQPLDPADYEMVGTLGQVSCKIRPDGVGEIIYVRDGARRMAAARSEDSREIGRGEEVVVTRYEKGIAYVRTWEAMTQTGGANSGPESLQKETKHVE